jgi:hypothetical protein
LTADSNTAARFSSGGEATVPSRDALNLNGAFTIEAWVKPEALPASGYPAVFRKGSSSRTDKERFPAGCSGRWARGRTSP